MSNETTNEVEHVETFDGYLAELIRVQAEKDGKTAEELVLSFFDARCNAPSRGDCLPN